MPNIDVSNLDCLNAEHVRLLRAIEEAMKNHEYAPLQVVNEIAQVESIHDCMADLCRYDLVEHVGGSSAGYKLTYEGFDYLAFRILEKRGVILAPERKIGVGKEAEVWLCSTHRKNEYAIVKLHKLGLNSFKTVRTARNYAKKQLPFYVLSQKAAAREAGFGTALQQRGFPVPHIYSVSLHAVCMELIPGVQMSRLRGLDAEQGAYLAWHLFGLMKRMLSVGVVHGDCNEYNCIVELDDSATCYADDTELQDENVFTEEDSPEEISQASPTLPVLCLPVKKQVFERITIIDFPQLIQFNDPQAEFQFDRDIESIEGFVNRRFKAGIRLPRFADAVRELSIGQEIIASENFARKIIKTMNEGLEEEFEADEDVICEEEAPNKYAPVIKYKTVDIKREARREADRGKQQRTSRKRMEKGEKKSQRDRYGMKNEY